MILPLAWETLAGCDTEQPVSISSIMATGMRAAHAGNMVWEDETLSWCDGTRKDYLPARNPTVLMLCWQSQRKALPPTALSFYRQMQSVGERQTHHQITDGEAKTKGMHGMQQPGINQFSYIPAQSSAMKMLLQVGNHTINQTWVMQSTSGCEMHFCVSVKAFLSKHCSNAPACHRKECCCEL